MAPTQASSGTTLQGRLEQPPTVLVVDEDRDILEIVTDILRSEGYRVIPVADAEQAIAASAGDHPIDLLLTDVQVPVMDGYSLARLLKARRPQLRVLYMTAGWAEQPEAEWLAKPFSIDALTSRVRELLEAKRGWHH